MSSAKCIRGPDAIFQMSGATNIINVTCFGLFMKIYALKHCAGKCSACGLLDVSAVCSYLYLEHPSVRILMRYVVYYVSRDSAVGKATGYGLDD
jgi:hypothetical protein